ncbi:uncharacterized protein ARMOST_13286 [Armillaria ostoyae]|uniref:Uncharacterized protein n=1 Tax=Armillaria ostoyae TaxID=47428 RepID=A0A284RMF8_ARMOS|nr:uncharacterized protein ARMOST_13286 [Armillaria ostoyae]
MDGIAVIRHRPRYMGLTPEDSRGAYVRGSIKDGISFYITGSEPTTMGFWGSKVPLPYDPDEGLKKNIEFFRKHRESVGPDYLIMVDCWMALNIQCTIELATVSWICSSLPQESMNTPSTDSASVSRAVTSNPVVPSLASTLDAERTEDDTPRTGIWAWQ